MSELSTQFSDESTNRTLDRIDQEVLGYFGALEDLISNFDLNIQQLKHLSPQNKYLAQLEVMRNKLIDEKKKAQTKKQEVKDRNQARHDRMKDTLKARGIPAQIGELTVEEGLERFEAPERDWRPYRILLRLASDEIILIQSEKNQPV